MSESQITCKDVVCSIFAKRIGVKLKPEYLRDECNRITRMLGIPKFNDPDRTARSLCDEGWLDKDANGNKILPLEKGLQGKCFRNVYELCQKNRATFPHQVITYGAPGTGKSWRTEKEVRNYSDTVRTTFHPDSDYATFVGSYKPSMEQRIKYGLQGQPILSDGKPLTEDVIVYKFIPQAFTKAYVRAWQKMAECPPGGTCEPQFLVIEEINRGNCAQVFGDIFQLLDRDKDGTSKYGIEADSSLAAFIAEALQSCGTTIPADIKSGAKLKLPPNLYIWATMNTSDQSLFPMDSAFKRRWEWEYVPISDHPDQNWVLAAGGQKFSWWKFLERINKSILDATKSEDKQLGYFFVRADDAGTIDCRKFVNKVLSYLYNDVFKDYYLPKGFSKDDGEMFAFKDFFLADGKVNEENVAKLLKQFLSDE